METVFYTVITLSPVIFFCLYGYYSVNRTNNKLYRDLAISRDKVHELEVKLHNIGKPELNTFWQHTTSGAVYEVVSYANLHTTKPIKYPVSIVYRNSEGVVWVRPAHDWHRSFTAYKPSEG